MDIVKKIMAAPEDSPSGMGSERDEATQQSNDRIDVMPKRSRSKSRSKSKKRPNSLHENDEVDLLRKEIEEMKFYQELEQTEYQEMKEKMHSYEKQMKDIEKRKVIEEKESQKEKQRSAASKLQKIDEESTMINSNMDTVDLLATNSVSIPRSAKNADALLQKRLKKRDSEIKQLKTKLNEKVTTSKQSSGKLKILAKEYEKRLNKMESLKDEEIEEIKDHYKQMMETLAKQVQKLNKRHQDEAEKNGKLRSMMEEMRNDMLKRESELEKKIKVQHNSLKKNEARLNKAETKLDRTGTKYSSTKIELDEALKSNRDLDEKVHEMEERHELEIREMGDKYEAEREETRKMHEVESKNLREAHEKEVQMLQQSFEEEISSLTGKLVDVEKLFHDEVEEHDKTAAKLEDLEGVVEDREAELEKLKLKIEEIEEHSDKLRQDLQDEINDRDQSASNRSIEYEKKVSDMARERMTVTNELKVANEKVHKLEQELKLLSEDKNKKNRTIKKHQADMDEMQERLNTINEVHLKEIKNRDIEFVKARKKWTLSEQKLRQELEEIHETQAKLDALQETASGNFVVERAAKEKKMFESQKKLIEQLKADKASLQMTVASIEGKNSQQLKALEKELANTKRLLSISAYERTLEQQLKRKEAKESVIHHENEVVAPAREEFEDEHEREEVSVPTPTPHYEPNNRELERDVPREEARVEEERHVTEERTDRNYNRPSSDELIETSEVSSESSTVPVSADSTKKATKGLTGQRSYRNYVRNRKFSKKISVRNE